MNMKKLSLIVAAVALFASAAQAEVKTILKASGDNYKKAREENDHNHSDNH